MVKDEYTIIIVDDIAETRDNLSKLLRFESDIEVLGVARTGREGIKIALDIQPDVILMDINMPDVDGIKATEIIREKIPSTQIVILSVQGDANYMRRAMLAGARDFLTKPPKADELVSAIRRAGRKAHEEKEKASIPTSVQIGRLDQLGSISQTVSRGKIIAIHSPKGGVGCTTVASNLAVVLQNKETPVALVDGNLQFGDIAVFFNERGRNSIVDLAPRADELDPGIIKEVMVHHNQSGIDILAAPSHPEDAEMVSGEQFVKILEYLKRLYAYIIVDLASALSEVTLETIDASDVLVILTTQGIPSINKLRIMLGLLEALGTSENQILLTMSRYDKRIAITPEKVGENVHHDIIAIIPEEQRVVVPSVNRGVPFMLEGKKSKDVVDGILKLAEVIRERLAILDMEKIAD